MATANPNLIYDTPSVSWDANTLNNPQSLTRGVIDQYLNSIQGQYSPNNVNQIAQALSNNKAGVSFQELQSRLGSGAANPQVLGTSTGSTGAATSDPNAVGAYSDIIDQLTRQLQSVQGQQGTGLNNIQQSYNQALDRTNQAQSQTLSNYAKQDQQNATNRETNLGSIGQNANNTYNSLMRILGLGGASVSSAAQQNIPNAVAQNATTQRTGAFNTYGQNASNIDTARKDAQTQYANAIQDLGNQKTSQTGAFLQGLLGQEGTINTNLQNAAVNRAEAGGASYAAASAAAGGYKNAANNIQNQLDQIFKQYATPTFAVNPVNVQTPNLAQFTADPTKIQAQQANPQTDASVLPYLQQIKQQPNLLTGSASAATGG